MAVMTISEARAALPEVLNRVADGEEITITRHGHPAAVVSQPDILWSRSGQEVIIDMDDAHLAGALRERARQRGRTLDEEIRLLLDKAHNQPPALPPLQLTMVEVGGPGTWSREEIYGDDAR